MFKKYITILLLIATVNFLFVYSNAASNIKPKSISDLKKSIVQVDVSVEYPSNDVKYRRGTGFSIANNKIITCYHIIGRTEGSSKVNIKITDYNQIKYKNYKIIYSNPQKDIAILEFKELNLKSLNSNKNYNLNDTVSIISIQKNVRCGVIIDDKFIDDEFNNNLEIKTNILVYKGDSGSPLLNSNNEFIGIIRAKCDNKSYAVPVNDIDYFK